MELLCVYELAHRDIRVLHSETVSWQEYLHIRVQSLSTYMYPCYKINGKPVVIDITQWLSDHPQQYTDITNKSWSDILTLLTPTDILSYRVDIGFLPGTNIPSVCCNTYELLSTPGLDIHYYDHKSWDQRDLFHYRYNLPDLLLHIHPHSPIYTQYKNCVPIIQGYCYMPEYIEDSTGNYISIQQGAQLLWSIYAHSSVSMFLLDFTPYGGIHALYPLNQCSLTTEFSSNEIDRSSSHLTCKLPDSALSLDRSTVFLVYGGIVYDPSQYTIINSRCFTFLPRTLPLEYQLIERTRYSTSINMTVTGDTHARYLDQVIQSTCRDAFIVQVATPHIYRYRYQQQLPMYAYTSIDSYGKLPSPLGRSRSTYKLILPQLATYQRYTALYQSQRHTLYMFDSDPREPMVGTDIYRGKVVDSFTELHTTHYDLDYWVKWV